MNSDSLEVIKEKIKPCFCCLAITDSCILKCKMCYKWQDAALFAMPTVEQYKRFISSLRGFVDEGFAINFAGGEPLLYEGVLDLVKYGVSNGFWTNIASNGWLINEEMAQRIGDSGLNEINLSLDGINESTHDYLRGVKGVYRCVMNALEYLNKYSKNTKICICAVIYDCNLDELLLLMKWAINNDMIASISILAPMQPNNTEIEGKWWEGKYSFLWPKDTVKVISFIDSVIEFKKKYYKISTPLYQLEAFKLYFRSPDKFAKNKKCNSDRAIHVNAKGDISLCFRYGESIGNIKSMGDISEFWYSNKAWQMRQKIYSCRDNCHSLLNCLPEEAS